MLPRNAFYRARTWTSSLRRVMDRGLPDHPRGRRSRGASAPRTAPMPAVEVQDEVFDPALPCEWPFMEPELAARWEQRHAADWPTRLRQLPGFRPIDPPLQAWEVADTLELEVA